MRKHIHILLLNDAIFQKWLIFQRSLWRKIQECNKRTRTYVMTNTVISKFSIHPRRVDYPFQLSIRFHEQFCLQKSRFTHAELKQTSTEVVYASVTGLGTDSILEGLLKREKMIYNLSKWY